MIPQMRSMLNGLIETVNLSGHLTVCRYVPLMGTRLHRVQSPTAGTARLSFGVITGVRTLTYTSIKSLKCPLQIVLTAQLR